MPHSMQLQIFFLFWSHQVNASPAMSCVLLQLEAIQSWMWVSVAMCSPLLLVWSANPPTFSNLLANGLTMWSPKPTIFEGTSCNCWLRTGITLKPGRVSSKNIQGINFGLCSTFSCSFKVEIQFLNFRQSETYLLKKRSSNSGYWSILSFRRKWALGVPTNRFPLVWEKYSNGKWLKTAVENKRPSTGISHGNMIVTTYGLSRLRNLVTPFDFHTFLQ